jgi:uncharacterized membrane protein
MGLRLPARPRPVRDDDRGMVTAFVVVFALALVSVSALVVDGGRMLAEAREVDNLADSAARAGAQAISDERVRAGSPTILDPDGAATAACAFLARAGRSCANPGTGVAVEGNTVTVTVRGRIDLLLLPGTAKTVSARGTACVAVGIATGTC